MLVCCDVCVLSGRGLRDELVTRPEESYLLWCVDECDLETSGMRRLWPTGGCSAIGKKEWICSSTFEIYTVNFVNLISIIFRRLFFN